MASIALLMNRPGDEDQVERIELMRPAGGATEIDDAAYLDLTPHPWAGLPVVVRLEAVDGIDQRGQSEPQELVLPCAAVPASGGARDHRAAAPSGGRAGAERDEVVAALDR